MRAGYLVQSHRDPDQVARLVRTLRHGSPDCLVHVSHDFASSPLDLAGVPGVVVRAARGGYGDFSHVRRYLDAVEDLAPDRPDWIVNITGQDYPIRPVAEAEAELAAGDADGYLEYFPALDPDRSAWPVRRARSRYLFRHRRLLALSPAAKRRLRPLQALNYVQPVLRVHVSYGLTVGIRRRSPFGPHFVLYGGSAYHSLSWPCVDYLREFCAARPEVLRYYEGTLSPVESLVQTILVNSGRFRLTGDCRRYFDFRGSTFNHPRFLGLEDLPRALASGADFARKIEDPAVLDALDAQL
ncbi:MAG TPA: hypothetical protein VGP02_15435 [Mycobacteriales bacterium]|jgi:hypothetical protein|nr:hypothetical protein [Mycobacteriales bacterium]